MPGTVHNITVEKSTTIRGFELIKGPFLPGVGSVIPPPPLADQISAAMARVAPTSYSTITVPNGTYADLDLSACAYPCQVVMPAGAVVTGLTLAASDGRNSFGYSVGNVSERITSVTFFPSGQIGVGVNSGQTFQFTATLPAETTILYNQGSPWAVNGAQKNFEADGDTIVTPTNTGGQKQGWDERYVIATAENTGQNYDPALRAVYPVTMSPGDTFTKCASRLPADPLSLSNADDARDFDPYAASINDSNVRSSPYAGFHHVICVDQLPGPNAFGFVPARAKAGSTYDGYLADPQIIDIDFAARVGELRSSITTKLAPISATLNAADYPDARNVTEVLNGLIPDGLTNAFWRFSASQYMTPPALQPNGNVIPTYGANLSASHNCALAFMVSEDVALHDVYRVYRAFVAQALMYWTAVEAAYTAWLTEDGDGLSGTLYDQNRPPTHYNNGLGGHEGQNIAHNVLALHALGRANEIQTHIPLVCPGNLDVYVRWTQKAADEIDTPHSDVGKLATSRLRNVLSYNDRNGVSQNNMVRVQAFPVANDQDPPNMYFQNGYALYNETTGQQSKIVGMEDAFPTGTGNDEGWCFIIEDADASTRFPLTDQVWLKPLYLPVVGEPVYTFSPQLGQPANSFVDAHAHLCISADVPYFRIQNWLALIPMLYGMGLLDATESPYRIAAEYILANTAAEKPNLDVDWPDNVTTAEESWGKGIFDDYAWVFIPWAKPEPLTLAPGLSATNQAVDVVPTITVSEAVSADPVTITLRNVTDAVDVHTYDLSTDLGNGPGQVEIVNGQPSQIHFHPPADFVVGKDYRLPIPGNAFKDADGNYMDAFTWEWSVGAALTVVEFEPNEWLNLDGAMTGPLDQLTFATAWTIDDAEAGQTHVTGYTASNNSMLYSDVTGNAVRCFLRGGGSVQMYHGFTTSEVSAGDTICAVIAFTRDSGTGVWSAKSRVVNATTGEIRTDAETNTWAAGVDPVQQFSRGFAGGDFRTPGLWIGAGYLDPDVVFDDFFDSADSYKPTAAFLSLGAVGGLSPNVANSRTGTAGNYNGADMTGEVSDAEIPYIWSDATISAVAADGWQATYPSPPAEFDPVSSPETFTVSDAGFNSSGAATTVNRTITVMKRVREPYPNENTLKTNTVSLSDFLLSTTAIQGVTNNSTVVDPKPVAMWLDHDTPCVYDQTYTARLAVAHWFAMNGRPVAAVVLSATDGTNTVSQTVNSMTKVDLGSGLSVPCFEATFDFSTLADDALITIDVDFRPWIGTERTASTDFAAYPSINFCEMKVFNAVTAAEAKIFAHVDPATGNDGTGVASTSDATAAASPFLTLLAAANAISALHGSHASRGEIVLAEGTTTMDDFSGVTIGETPLIVRGASAAVKATTILQNTASGGTDRIPDMVKFQDLTLKQNNASDIFLDNNAGAGSSNMLVTENVNFDDNGIGSYWGAFVYRVARWWCIECEETSNVNGLLSVFSTANKTANVIGGLNIGLANCTSAYNIVGTKDLADAKIGYQEGGNREVRSGAVLGWNIAGTSIADRILQIDEPVGAGGVAIVGNILERRAGAAANVYLNADGNTDPTENAMVDFNTSVGDRFNIGYNDVGTVAVPKVVRTRGNITDERNTKTDVFGANSNLDGNWPIAFNVGSSHNALIYGSNGNDVYGAGEWPGEVQPIGEVIGTSVAPLATGFVDDQSINGGGAGDGDYRITGPTDVPHVPAALMAYPYDLLGTAYALDGTDYAGAVA